MGGPRLSEGYLLDTHVWLWHLGGSERLPERLRALIDSERERCWLSPISVWEAGMLAGKGVIRVEGGIREWLETARRRLPLREAHLNAEIAMTSLEVDLEHRDPADRFLAATALVFDLVLLTLDGRLTRAGWLPTLDG